MLEKQRCAKVSFGLPRCSAAQPRAASCSGAARASSLAQVTAVDTAEAAYPKDAACSARGVVDKAHDANDYPEEELAGEHDAGEEPVKVRTVVLYVTGRSGGPSRMDAWFAASRERVLS